MTGEAAEQGSSTYTYDHANQQTSESDKYPNDYRSARTTPTTATATAPVRRRGGQRAHFRRHLHLYLRRRRQLHGEVHRRPRHGRPGRRRHRRHALLLGLREPAGAGEARERLRNGHRDHQVHLRLPEPADRRDRHARGRRARSIATWRTRATSRMRSSAGRSPAAASRRPTCSWRRRRWTRCSPTGRTRGPSRSPRGR